MCTELILAILYFLILLIINYILTRILNTYLEEILYQYKLKTIYKFFPKQNLQFVSFLHEKKIKEQKKIQSVSSIISFSFMEDILIIGNIYKFLSIIEKKNSKESFYLKLKEIQYLPSFLEEK